MSSDNTQRKLITFLVLTIGMSSAFWFFIISAGTIKGQLILGLMWCPGVAALITQLLFQRNLRGLGWGWGRSKYQWWSYSIPFLYTLVAYSTVWISGYGGFYNHQFVTEAAAALGRPVTDAQSSYLFIAFLTLLSGTLGMTTGCIYALGEEIGWRGMLVPLLAKKLSFSKTALVSGAIWAAWHLPIIIFADYNGGTPLWYGISCFTVMIVGMSIAMAWLRIKSGSLWTAMLFHASHNKFVQVVFTPLTVDTGNTKYFIDEFGIALAIVCAVVGFIFWRKRLQLEGLSKAGAASLPNTS